MAKIDTSGIDELCKALENLSGAGADAIADEFLIKAGKIGVEQWRAAIQRAGHVQTGGMLRKVGATKPKRSKDGSLALEVYPKGKHPTAKESRSYGSAPMTYAGVAFALNYGNSNLQGSRFVQAAEAAMEKPIQEACEEIMDKYLKKEGLT